jgi:phosphate transport system permease protein
MAAVIANEFADAAGGPIHESALIYLALILFGVTVLVNGAARLLIWRVSKSGGGT